MDGDGWLCTAEDGGNGDWLTSFWAIFHWQLVNVSSSLWGTISCFLSSLLYQSMLFLISVTKYEVCLVVPSGLCWVGRVYVQCRWLPNENTCRPRHVVFKTEFIYKSRTQNKGKRKSRLERPKSVGNKINIYDNFTISMRMKSLCPSILMRTASCWKVLMPKAMESFLVSVTLINWNWMRPPFDPKL